MELFVFLFHGSFFMILFAVMKRVLAFCVAQHMNRSQLGRVQANDKRCNRYVCVIELSSIVRKQRTHFRELCFNDKYLNRIIRWMSNKKRELFLTKINSNVDPLSIKSLFQAFFSSSSHDNNYWFIIWQKKPHRIMSSLISLITLYKFEYWCLENGGFYFSMFCQWEWQPIVTKCAANYGKFMSVHGKNVVCECFFHSVRSKWKYEKYARHIQMNFTSLRSNKWQFFFHFISFGLYFCSNANGVRVTPSVFFSLSFRCWWAYIQAQCEIVNAKPSQQIEFWWSPISLYVCARPVEHCLSVVIEWIFNITLISLAEWMRIHTHTHKQCSTRAQRNGLIYRSFIVLIIVVFVSILNCSILYISVTQKN